MYRPNPRNGTFQAARGRDRESGSQTRFPPIAQATKKSTAGERSRIPLEGNSLKLPKLPTSNSLVGGERVLSYSKEYKNNSFDTTKASDGRVILTKIHKLPPDQESFRKMRQDFRQPEPASAVITAKVDKKKRKRSTKRSKGKKAPHKKPSKNSIDKISECRDLHDHTFDDEDGDDFAGIAFHDQGFDEQAFHQMTGAEDFDDLAFDQSDFADVAFDDQGFDEQAVHQMAVAEDFDNLAFDESNFADVTFDDQEFDEQAAADKNINEKISDVDHDGDDNDGGDDDDEDDDNFEDLAFTEEDFANIAFDDDDSEEETLDDDFFDEEDLDYSIPYSNPSKSPSDTDLADTDFSYKSPEDEIFAEDDTDNNTFVGKVVDEKAVDSEKCVDKILDDENLEGKTFDCEISDAKMFCDKATNVPSDAKTFCDKATNIPEVELPIEEFEGNTSGDKST